MQCFEDSKKLQMKYFAMCFNTEKQFKTKAGFYNLHFSQRQGIKREEVTRLFTNTNFFRPLPKNNLCTWWLL